MWWIGVASAITPAPDASVSCGAGCTVRELGAGDFTGDGYGDVLLYNGGVWKLSEGQPGALGPLSNTSIGGTEVLVADVNGDGVDDVITWDPASAQHRLEVWFGGVNFPRASPNQTDSIGTTSPTVGDFDGDGYDDLAFDDNGYAPVKVRYGGPNGLGAAVNVTTGYVGGTVASADGDGDGYDDLFILTNYSDLRRYRGGPNGLAAARDITFQTPGLSSFDELHPIGGDLDGDGQDDLMIYTSSGDARMIYSRGATMRMGPTAQDVTRLLVIDDIDGDGDDEFAGGKPNLGPGEVLVVFGGAPPTVGARLNGTSPIGQVGRALGTADFNGDGRSDLATNEGSSVVVYYGP